MFLRKNRFKIFNIIIIIVVVLRDKRII